MPPNHLVIEYLLNWFLCDYQNSTIEVEENQKNGTTLNGLITASDVDEDALLTAQIIWDDSYAKKNFRTLDSNNATIKEQIR